MDNDLLRALYRIKEIDFSTTSDSAEELAKKLVYTDENFIGFIQSIKDGKIQLKSSKNAVAEYSAYLKASGSVADITTTKTELLSGAMKALSSIGWMIAITAITSIISKIAQANEEARRRAQEAVDAYKTETEALRDKAKSLEELKTKYAELYQGVDAFNNNQSLTNEQYNEYLDVCNRIGDMFPSLIKGFDEQGNVILKVAGNVDTLTEAYNNSKKAAETALKARGGDIIKNFRKEYKDTNDERAYLDMLKRMLTSEKGSWLSLGQDFNKFTIDFVFSNGDMLTKYLRSKGYKKQTGEAYTTFLDRIKQEYGRELFELVEILEDETEDIIASSGIKDLFGTILNNYLDSDEYNLPDNIKTIIKSVFSGLGVDFYEDIDSMDDIISKARGLISAFSGLNADEQAKLIYAFDITSKLNSNEVSVKEYLDIINQITPWLNSLPDEVQKQIRLLLSLDNSGNKSYEDMLNSIYTGGGGVVDIDGEKLASERKNWARGLNAEDLKIAYELSLDPENAEKSLDDWIALLEAKKKEIEGNPIELTIKETISGFTDSQDGFDKLAKIYNDVKDKGTFDFGALVDKDFVAQFGNLSSYENFLKVVANSPTDLAACQAAFNRLTAEYVLNSSELKNVTDETKKATIAFLEQNGVANATAIVDAQLAVNKKKVELATEGVKNAEEQAIISLLASAEAGSIEAQALQSLLIEKVKVNQTTIQTSGDIQNLENLAKAAGATVTSLNNLARAKQLMADAEKHEIKKEQLIAQWRANPSSVDIRAIESEMSQAQWKYQIAKQYYGEDIAFEYSWGDVANYTPPTSSSGSGSSKSDKTETWFEKQYKEHKHLVEMEQETESDYLTWLNKAYKQAYSENIIELDDYNKYQEEVYNGLRDLYKDYLNDIEHDISMRENYDGESKKIISLYKTLISSVEKEIANARSQGLDDNSDYIQELQGKWQDYTNSIKEIEEDLLENAKDAVNELVEYRIDMLKQDVDREKDALDKKLDNLKEFYDKQKEMLQDQHDEEEYLKEQSEKRKSVSDLQSELAMLSRDDSAWAQKRRIELQEELSKAQEDLNEFEDDHALELALDALDNAYNAQEAQLQAEMDALEEKLNDPEALYNKALNDIKTNTGNLYAEMLEYNRRHGSGNDADIKDKYEEAYKALLEYKQLNGKDYEGVSLKNATGYKQNTMPSTASVVAQSKPTQQATTQTSATTAKTTNTPAPSLTTGSYVNIKSGTRWHGDSYGGGTSGTAHAGTIKYINEKGSHPYNIDGLGWVKKSDIVGYARGTSNATVGIHRVDELGAEALFTSKDGTKYRFLNAGDKVLTAHQTDFLYNFAKIGEERLASIFSCAPSVPKTIRKGDIAPVINMGDIIIQGNTNEKTVSEIRREQREQITRTLKEFNRLNNNYI